MIGGICYTNNKSYTCFFNQNNTENNEWIHYEDENISYFKEYVEIIKLLIKNQQTPNFLIYKIQEKNNEKNNKDLTQETIFKLEKFASNIDNYNMISKNKFRPNDDTIKYDIAEDRNQNNNNFKRNNVGANQNSSTNNSSITSENSEYTCVICYQRNKVEHKICIKCKKNNESQIKDMLLLKRKSSEKSSNLNNNQHIVSNNAGGNSEKDFDDSLMKNENFENRITSIKHNKITIEKLANPFENHVKITNSSSKPKILIGKNSSLNNFFIV